jgi:DNA-binding transcriptional MocR family regulator
MTGRPAEDVENTMARSTSAAKDTASGDEQPVQLTLQAAEIIRDLIRRGELLPGEKIHQVEVARNAGVSRSPLREALRTLAAEGLVKYETNRGYVVSRLRMEELAEIYGSAQAGRGGDDAPYPEAGRGRPRADGRPPRGDGGGDRGR